jgi:preprotein translocase subunit SecD
MSKKDLLKQKAKGKLAIDVKDAALAVVPREKEGDLKRITIEIKSDLDELRDIAEWWKAKKDRVVELKQSIIEKLIYVRDHRKKLLVGRPFEEYLSNDVGISKGYFYEQLQAYNICAEYQKPGLFKKVDHKILVNIAREKDKDRQKELIQKAPTLSREDFKKVSPTDFSRKEAAGDDEDAFIATVNRDALSIKVTDTRILQQIESLLKANGIKIEYV